MAGGMGVSRLCSQNGLRPPPTGVDPFQFITMHVADYSLRTVIGRLKPETGVERIVIEAS